MPSLSRLHSPRTQRQKKGFRDLGCLGLGMQGQRVQPPKALPGQREVFRQIQNSPESAAVFGIRETPSQHHGTQGVYTPRTDQNPGARSPYKYQREPRNPKEQYWSYYYNHYYMLYYTKVTTIDPATLLHKSPLLKAPGLANPSSPRGSSQPAKA